jgi:hypothetical protein
MLFLHEAAAIQADPEAQRRLIVSYKLMLDFYGMQLVDEQLGVVARAVNYRSRYAHLNRSFHNYLRVTRILKCLGELGREELKLGFLLHVVRELVEGELSAKSVGKSAVNYCQSPHAAAQRHGWPNRTGALLPSTLLVRSFVCDMLAALWFVLERAQGSRFCARLQTDSDCRALWMSSKRPRRADPAECS